MSLRKIEGNVDDNSITVETPVEELRANILSGDIVVLKNVFEPEAMRNLRNSVFEWGQETPQLIDSTSKKH